MPFISSRRTFVKLAGLTIATAHCAPWLNRLTPRLSNSGFFN
jgi:hypothetical protein